MFEKLIEASRKKKVNIAVIGDAMIDEYYHVTANRISPEFPIPVMKSSGNISGKDPNDYSSECKEHPDVKRPGGAANVAYQFKNFGVNAYLSCFANMEDSLFFRQCDIDNRFYGEIFSHRRSRFHWL